MGSNACAAEKKYKSDLHAIAAAYFSIATYYAQINSRDF